MTARWLVDAVAVYRLTKLATDDGITQPIRDRIIEAAYIADGRAEEAKRAYVDGITGGDDGPPFMFSEGDWQAIAEEDPLPPKLAVLVTCRWCASVWVALGLVYLVRRTRWWPKMADVLAFSAAGALLARLED
jgi:hypothetical protein